jgi:hypothetical protein
MILIVRANASEILNWDRSGIMLITGHKSEGTVRRYLRRRRDKSLFRSAEAVHTALKRSFRSTCVSNTEGESNHVRITAASEKKMRVHIDGNKNAIDVTFE